MLKEMAIYWGNQQKGERPRGLNAVLDRLASLLGLRRSELRAFLFFLGFALAATAIPLGAFLAASSKRGVSDSLPSRALIQPPEEGIVNLSDTESTPLPDDVLVNVYKRSQTLAKTSSEALRAGDFLRFTKLWKISRESSGADYDAAQYFVHSNKNQYKLLSTPRPTIDIYSSLDDITVTTEFAFAGKGLDSDAVAISIESHWSERGTKHEYSVVTVSQG